MLGAVLAALAGVSACGERPQTMSSGSIGDAAAFQGAKNQFVAPGWKPGDRNNWEQALKVRTVQGQNDYAKVP